MLQSITLTNFLSFGPDPVTLELRPLNVLIGANGSGKSNLVEAFAVLRAVPKDVSVPIRQGGGVDDFFWNSSSLVRAQAAELGVIFSETESDALQVEYAIQFSGKRGRLAVADEFIRVDSPSGRFPPTKHVEAGSYGARLIDPSNSIDEIPAADYNDGQSILAQIKAPLQYPYLTRVANHLEKILIYRAWCLGPQSQVRTACRSDVQTDVLLEDFSNLAARITELKRDPATKRKLISLIKDVAPGFTDVEVILEGGRLALYLTEGERNISAQRLSDGTLRWLCLATILIDPGPAKLVVIEEPELGLHPDLMPSLRDLLIEASDRVQLVVTTHSTVLVDAFSEHSGCVVVCEKEEMSTSLTRLSEEDVARWREFGSLGQLWMSGQFGGTRW